MRKKKVAGMKKLDIFLILIGGLFSGLVAWLTLFDLNLEINTILIYDISILVGLLVIAFLTGLCGKKKKYYL